MGILPAHTGQKTLADQYYGRAYERAVRMGNMESIISWELVGFRAEDGSIALEVPLEVKMRLHKNPLYKELLKQVESTVQQLRDARFSFGERNVAPNV